MFSALRSPVRPILSKIVSPLPTIRRHYSYAIDHHVVTNVVVHLCVSYMCTIVAILMMTLVSDLGMRGTHGDHERTQLEELMAIMKELAEELMEELMEELRSRFVYKGIHISQIYFS